ncbi:MAG: ABC transporter permease, partial [Anaerolineae bacterium]|nr:ABC transporter permease [Anaerolineae bacterium]
FPVLVENPEQAPELVRRLEAEEAINLVPPPNDPNASTFGEAVVIVSIPPDFQNSLASTGGGSVRLITSDNSLITNFGAATVRGVLDAYNEELLDQRLADAGLTRAWLRPITIDEGRRARTETLAEVSNQAAGDASTEEDEGGGNILATIFLPLAVTSWLLGGGLGLILDTTVGEKERQTIENLLVTPASRMGIVLGKLTVVFMASFAVMGVWLLEGLLLNAVSLAAPELLVGANASPAEAARLLGESTTGLAGLIVQLLVLIVPFTVILNGLVMAWCAYAANYREANLVMALIQLGLPASVILTIFSLPPDVGLGFYAVPFFGTIVAIRDLFSDTLTPAGLLVHSVTALTYAGLSTGFAAWMFGREWSLTRGLQ